MGVTVPKPSKPVLFLLVVFMFGGSVTPVFGQNSLPDKNHDKAAAATDVAYQFLLRIGAVDPSTEGVEHTTRVEGVRESFNPTTGNTIEFKLADAWMRVSMDTGAVVSAMFIKHSPRSVAVFDESGRPVTQEEMERKLVRCTQDEARKSALAYVHHGYGEHVLDHLDIHRAELVFRGSFFSYYFSWVENTNDEGVAFGFRRLTVNINSESCAVADARFVESIPQRKPAMAADQAKQAVFATENGGDQHDASLICLLQLLRPVGSPVLAWAVSYEETSAGAPSGLSIGPRTRTKYVNDGTGGVYPSARELLDAAGE